MFVSYCSYDIRRLHRLLNVRERQKWSARTRNVTRMSQSELEMFIEMVSGGAISVITLCVIAPFVEEMLFRGLFLRGFLFNYSPARSIVLASLLFGLAHLNVYQFVVASILGLLSGWL